MDELFSGRLAVIGLGYIGLPTAVVLATRGVDVVGVDVNPRTVAAVENGEVPFVEPDLAVAVNGRIEAVGRSFRLKGETAESYAVMVPEDALRDGRNTVEVLDVTDDGAMVLLARS